LTFLKAYEAVYNEENHYAIHTEKGYPYRCPLLQDTSSAAVKVSEDASGSSAGAVQDPTSGVIDFPQCPTYRTTVYVSIEMATDVGFDLNTALAAAFAVRFARGAGPDILAALYNGSTLGAHAAGATGIVYSDLIALLKSLDPAYRAGAVWIMNDNTLLYLLGLLDSVGHPILQVSDNTLLGHRLVISPAMPDIAASAVPIIVYNPHFLVVRWAKSYMTLQIDKESMAEYGLVGFRGYLRVQATLAQPTSGPSSAVYLQNASS
jgi:HK97 family phage major capsid protein